MIDLDTLYYSCLILCVLKFSPKISKVKSLYLSLNTKCTLNSIPLHKRIVKTKNFSIKSVSLVT